MGIPHKAFDFKGIVILLALIPVFFASQAVAQENPLFVVEGVNVDVTAENSVAAQQKAFEEAQQFLISYSLADLPHCDAI